MPNKSGIGFKGVKLQSINRELIQCSECGEWLQQITHFHLRKHKLTTAQYKKKYGLNKGTSLCSDVTSNRMAKHMIENNVKYYDKILRNRDLFVANSKNKRKGRKETMERKNLLGTCPKQLEQKIVNHINRFHMLPARSVGRDGFQHMTMLKNRHVNLNGIYKFYGLPTKQRIGSRLMQWKFSDGTYYFIEKGKGWEELYIKMKQKCKILK